MQMNRLRRFLAVFVFFVLVAGSWLWWNRPQKSDMAAYAPGDCLLYLESNSLTDVAEAIINTDAWRSLNSLGLFSTAAKLTRLQKVLAWTGLGPTQQVVLARAQVAFVILELGTVDEGTTLKIKPDAAILVETHTSNWRIKPLVEKTLSDFAVSAYQQPTFSRSTDGPTEFMQWTAPDSTRQIVCALNGTLVVIGNNERAVRNCLATRLGQYPSLRDSGELQQMREMLSSNEGLAFGFISSKNAARLVSLGIPLLFGRAPGDLRLERLIVTSATKILGSIGWVATSATGGIEDHYLFLLQPAVVSRLVPLRKPGVADRHVLETLPTDVRSLTIYNYEDSLAAWQSLESAIGPQLDTLSAVVFDSLLESALLSYGIQKPKRFLEAVDSNIISIRRAQDPEHSLLIARLRDERSFRESIERPTANTFKEQSGNSKIFDQLENGAAAALTGQYVVLGPSAEVRDFVRATGSGMSMYPGLSERVTLFARSTTQAGMMTYSDDSERASRFLASILQLGQRLPAVEDRARINQLLAQLPFSATETTLTDHGFERQTRSSFGLFGVLVPLLRPESGEARQD